MEYTVIFRGIRGQVLFFDDKDRGRFVNACALIPSAKGFDHCGRATNMEFMPESATVRIESWEWPVRRIAQFVCDTYDAYYRLRYQCSGPQTVYEITNT